MSASEVYKLGCFACDETVALPAAEGQLGCPNCSAVLQIEWHGAGAFDQQQREAQHT
jgi:hypothetical protein